MGGSVPHALPPVTLPARASTGGDVALTVHRLHLQTHPTLTGPGTLQAPQVYRPYAGSGHKWARQVARAGAERLCQRVTVSVRPGPQVATL